jgi:hypothetical protein
MGACTKSRSAPQVCVGVCMCAVCVVFLFVQGVLGRSWEPTSSPVSGRLPCSLLTGAATAAPAPPVLLRLLPAPLSRALLLLLLLSHCCPCSSCAALAAPPLLPPPAAAVCPAPGDLFAIKVMTKTDLVRKNMVESVTNERNILAMVSLFFFGGGGWDTCEGRRWVQGDAYMPFLRCGRFPCFAQAGVQQLCFVPAARLPLLTAPSCCLYCCLIVCLSVRCLFAIFAGQQPLCGPLLLLLFIP